MLVMVFVHVTLEQHEASWIAELISKNFLSLEKRKLYNARDTILLSQKENIIFGSLARRNRDKNGSSRVSSFLTQGLQWGHLWMTWKDRSRLVTTLLTHTYRRMPKVVLWSYTNQVWPDRHRSLGNKVQSIKEMLWFKWPPRKAQNTVQL